MRYYMAVTDVSWFEFLRRRPELEEVNDWLPGGPDRFAALRPGELLLFKLQAPINAVAGGAYFLSYHRLPLAFAWSAFGIANGVPDYAAMRERWRRHHGAEPNDHADRIGSLILSDPFYLDESDWLSPPSDFAKSVSSGKVYAAGDPAAYDLWAEMRSRLIRDRLPGDATAPAVPLALDDLIEARPTGPRLGSGAFQAGVADAYGWRCALSGETAVPALHVAAVRPVSMGGGWRIDNGMLLRSDLARLFEAGYLTIAPDDLRCRTSTSLAQDFPGSDALAAIDGSVLRVPGAAGLRPRRELLAWHVDHVFRP